jgi:putative ABC transport system ATP-binding protein
MLNDERNPAVLHLSGIKKVFSTDELETHALSDVHFSVREGEYVAIEGPSGSGKTTLLSILGLLEQPTAGIYRLHGVEVGTLDGRARARLRNRHIGFIFQTFNLIGDLSVWENVELPLIYGGLSSGERKPRVDEALERVQMSHRKNHTPSQLSGGQQQRVAVARAIAGKPAILLADEPTGSLDSKNGDAVMSLLDELHASGSTLCMVTHSHEFAQRASRAIQLFDGRIVADASRAA